MTDEQQVTIGGIPLTKTSMKQRRMSLLLWGMSKCGKTTLAATAPGKKLWISFDPDATAPLGACKDEILELDLSGQPDRVVERFKDEKSGMCREIDKLLGEDDTIDTVVVDSVTSFGTKALTHGVEVAKSTTKGRSATLEDPGFSGYGNKNTWTRLLVSNLLKITARHNKHIIFIAHEDKPEKTSEGVVLFITIMLGSSLAQQVPVELSEVWHMEIAGSRGEHRIQIRPCRSYKPMGTRMFRTTGEPEFNWNFDPDTWEGEGIADWYDAWRAADFAKIPIPEKAKKK